MGQKEYLKRLWPFSKINKPQNQGAQRTPNRINLKHTHTQAYTHIPKHIRIKLLEINVKEKT